jgi:probable phosphoglycerate mutase
MSAIIYLLRHGETHWNRAGRLQGQLDSPLTHNGIEQAYAMGHTLTALLPKDGVNFWSSPIGRSRQTAAIIAEIIGHPFEQIQFDDRLKEITLGDWDGVESWAALDALAPEEAARRRTDPWNHQPPNGESSQMVEDRTIPFLLECETGGCHLVVAHGVVNKIIRGHILGLDHEATFNLDRPQNGFYRIQNRQIDFIEAVGPQ